MKTVLVSGIRVMMLALACVVMIGCSSAPAPEKHYYLLRTPDSLRTGDGQAGAQVGKVVVPAYLRSAQLAVKVSETEIRPANFHLWAEPAPEAIERFFRLRLAAAHADVEPTAWPRVDIDIVELLGNLQGEVHLTAMYTFYEGAKSLGPPRLYTDTVRQSRDGYAGLVEAHNQLLERLAVEISASIPGS
ncbi:PqiC family protein [Parahaliea mediterranea]|uniref:PqiC family protein n=1 Tax=Parahaliea mediterranea TaxID=651086 RepID=UPI000E2E93E0|nr:PqiC family protein [Parahaliea mediterranea]